MSRWTCSNIPPLVGRTALVTGASGLGFETARALARAGAQVILASRNIDKGSEAIDRIRRETPSAFVAFEPVDLSSLASVKRLSERLHKQTDRLDILVNNAGVMSPRVRLETADGFELQFGTNHLGHFALTGRLWPLLLKAEQARVVTVSSVAARHGRIDLDDLQARRAYRPMPVYARSKLACLMFALELQRRSQAAGLDLTSIAAHPGLSRTNLLYSTPGGPSPLRRLTRRLLGFLFQPADQGALPQLFAATAPQAQGGGYYGPDGFAGLNGFPAPAPLPQAAMDDAVRARLWTASEALTGVRFPGAADNRSLSLRRESGRRKP